MTDAFALEENPPPARPSLEHDLNNSLAYLKTHSPELGSSLYDHLSELLRNILLQRPRNALGIFEEYSKKLKDSRFKSKKGNYIRDLPFSTELYEDAKKLIQLYQIKDLQDSQSLDDEEEEKIYEPVVAKPSLINLFFNFEKNGVSLSRAEMILVDISFRKFISTAPIANVRFWGKILGLKKNYYIMEAVLTDTEINQRIEDEEIEINEQKNREEDAQEETQTAIEDEQASLSKSKQPSATETSASHGNAEHRLELVFPPMPKRNWQPPPVVPMEKIGSGANSKVYYVCNRPGKDDWVELPLVTPQQIVIARQIKRYFTGNLEEPIHTFPPFPGNEKNYLRAQIARIGAATLISPIGYFTFGRPSGEEEDEDEELMDDDEEEEEEINEGQITENPHYEPLPLKDLIDPTLSNWCHHSPYILMQGRTEWWDPKSAEAKKQDEEDEEEEEEEDEEGEEDEELGEEGDLTKDKEIKREIGPSLLTPLSEDAASDTFSPWTVRQSTIYQPDVAVAFVYSNTWPGAYAIAFKKQFANVYIGSGQKYIQYNYSPPNLPMAQDQYKIGPDITEAQDPTFEEEEDYRIAHLPKELSLEYEAEEDDDDDEEDEED